MLLPFLEFNQTVAEYPCVSNFKQMTNKCLAVGFKEPPKIIKNVYELNNQISNEI